jgi:hypothetical protein
VTRVDWFAGGRAAVVEKKKIEALATVKVIPPIAPREARPSELLAPACQGIVLNVGA